MFLFFDFLIFHTLLSWQEYRDCEKRTIPADHSAKKARGPGQSTSSRGCLLALRSRTPSHENFPSFGSNRVLNTQKKKTFF